MTVRLSYVYIELPGCGISLFSLPGCEMKENLKAGCETVRRGGGGGGGKRELLIFPGEKTV